MEDFRKDYNEYRPHKSLDRKSPNQMFNEKQLYLTGLKN
ncbi:hypothetical protein [Maribacter sp. 2-571]